MNRQHDWVSYIEGEPIPYTLYRMPRRRRVHLVISRDGHLQVRAPYRFTQSEAERAIHSRSAWIIETLQGIRASYSEHRPLRTGSRLSFLDETLYLHVEKASLSSVKRRENTLYIWVPVPDEQNIQVSLERWYRRRAKDYLPKRLAILANSVGVHPSRVSIRGQKTRWGSCSAKGCISLNWRLMLLPTQLVDYVLVHELCHLYHLDHSPSFWALVDRQIPDRKKRRAQLATVRINEFEMLECI